jgi:cold shock CspA family protein
MRHGSKDSPGLGGRAALGLHERGTVESFDREVGLGRVRAESGQLYPFHCTQVAGGTRDIAVGTRTRFVVWPGHMGSWEARSVEPTG